MGEGIFNKFKNWITEEEEDFDGVEEEYEQEDEEEVEQFTSIPNTKTAKIVNLHTASPMKVVIVEPKNMRSYYYSRSFKTKKGSYS